jgi:hypothetical protein
MSVDRQSLERRGSLGAVHPRRGRRRRRPRPVPGQEEHGEEDAGQEDRGEEDRRPQAAQRLTRRLHAGTIVRLKPCIAFRRVGDRPSPPQPCGPRGDGRGSATSRGAGARPGTRRKAMTALATVPACSASAPTLRAQAASAARATCSSSGSRAGTAPPWRSSSRRPIFVRRVWPRVSTACPARRSATAFTSQAATGSTYRSAEVTVTPEPTAGVRAGFTTPCGSSRNSSNHFV